MQQLESNHQTHLQQLFHYFENKSFFAHKAQGLPCCLLTGSYDAEESCFKKTVLLIPRTEVLSSTNMISSHVLYKLKLDHDSTLKLKALIASCENEDGLKYGMHSDCSICAPCGIWILLSIATIKGWRLSKADARSAFSQTGEATRNVYVTPFRESKHRYCFLWLLQTAAHGLFNTTSKF